MILTTKRPVCTNMGRKHASFLTSFIWGGLFSFSYLQGTYVCYPQANKCLSLDTCEWQKVFTAWNTNNNTNKGALIHESPQNIYGTKPVQRVRAGAGLNVRFGPNAGAKGVIYPLLTIEMYGNERGEITPEMLNSSRSLFWEPDSGVGVLWRQLPINICVFCITCSRCTCSTLCLPLFCPICQQQRPLTVRNESTDLSGTFKINVMFCCEPV